MKIGLLSDTHGYLDPKLFDFFKACDEIWHAGDIGNEKILAELRNFRPLRAVWGNIDDHKIRIQTREIDFFQVNEKHILMIHIGASPPRFNKGIRQLLSEKKPDLLICGHSHLCKVQYDTNFRVLYMNPGAAGKHGFHKIRTALRFEINEKIEGLEVIELGKRGA
jgi:hypothetical protein